MIVDLHLHTTFSDGLLTPSQVVDFAIKKKLNGIAITDHDSVEGIKFAKNRAKSYENFCIIPGIEFSCVYLNEEVHLLGYCFNYNSKQIITLTKKLKKARVTRGIKIIEKLNNLGININLNNVMKYAKRDYIGRPHIGRALIEKEYVNTMEEAFVKYLNRGKPAYVERYKLQIKEVIDLIHDENGIVILAHPGLIKNKNIINYCIDAGVDGLEVIHSKHSNENVLEFLNLTKKFNLIATGGSDWHGAMSKGKCLLGKYYVNLNYIPEINRRLKNVYI